MAITSLIIDGFQIHQHKKLILDKHATVLVGDNDTGKSTVVRALRWLSLNRWDGKADQMMNWYAKEVSVKAKFDGHWIERKKSKESNVYLLDGVVYEAVGVGNVPKAIADIINLTEENFQGQADDAFWFYLTGGEVAKSLNRIVNLGSIDTSLDSVASDLRSSREALRIATQRLEEAKQVKESLVWTKKVGSKLQDIRAIASELEGFRSQLASLTRGAQVLDTEAAIQARASGVISAAQRAIQVAQELSEYNNKLQQLRQAQAELMRSRQEIKACQSELIKVQAEWTKATKNRCPTCGQALKS